MKMRTILFTTAGLLAGAFFLFQNGNISLNSKTVVKEWIDKGAFVADVRTPEEYAQWHFEGSINIPLSEMEDKINLFGSKDNNIIVYCRSGNRSARAKDILDRHGYKNVLNGGGIKDMQF